MSGRFRQAGNVVFESNSKKPLAKIERLPNTDLRASFSSVDELSQIVKRNHSSE
jgi:hypothetical protein